MEKALARLFSTKTETAGETPRSPSRQVPEEQQQQQLLRGSSPSQELAEDQQWQRPRAVAVAHNRSSSEPAVRSRGDSGVFFSSATACVTVALQKKASTPLPPSPPPPLAAVPNMIARESPNNTSSAARTASVNTTAASSAVTSNGTSSAMDARVPGKRPARHTVDILSPNTPLPVSSSFCSSFSTNHNGSGAATGPTRTPPCSPQPTAITKYTDPLAAGSRGTTPRAKLHTKTTTSTNNNNCNNDAARHREPFENECTETSPSTSSPAAHTPSSSPTNTSSSSRRDSAAQQRRTANNTPQPPSDTQHRQQTTTADTTCCPQEGGFFFHTKPRLGRFTRLIAFLLKQGESRSLELYVSTLSKETKTQYDSVFSLSQLISLCDEATAILSHEPSLLRIKVNLEREELVVVGDIHGQFNDLYRSVLSQQYNYTTINTERKDKLFLFLGDFVDRGPHSLETILLVLALKVEYPHLVYMIRGNHEEKTTSRVYGFLTEVVTKRGKDEGAAVWEIITSTFASLPLAAIVDVEHKKHKERNFSFFATHGGLSPELMDGLDCIKTVRRESYGVTREKTALSFLPPDPKTAGTAPQCLTVKEEELCKGLMWSDPTNDTGLFGRNPRGCGFLFGPSASEQFCAKNKLSFIVRAHQVVMEGYLWKHNERVLTVFSAPNYCGINSNLGAIMIVRDSTQPDTEDAEAQAEGANARLLAPSSAFGVVHAEQQQQQEQESAHRYVSFVQYEAAEDLMDYDDAGTAVLPSMSFPYSSCFL